MFPLTSYLVIAFTFLTLLIYDVLVAVFVNNAATLSKCMQYIGYNWRIVIVFSGGLMAHFYCPKEKHWCGFKELDPIICLVLGFITFRYAWAQSP